MRMTRPSVIATLITVGMALLVSLPALASGGHGGGEPHVNWWGFDAHAPAVGWLLVDFAIFIGIIYFLGRRPMSEFLAARSQKIRKSLEEAKKAKEEAEARAGVLEQRLKDLDGEIKKLRDDIRTSGERERAQLEEDGKKAAERLIQDTETQIQNELVRAKESLKAETVSLSMELADHEIRKQLTADDYTRLNAQFVTTFTETEASQ